MLRKYSSLILASSILMLSQQSIAQTTKKTTTKKTTTTKKAPVKSVASGGFTKGNNSLDYKVITKGTGLVTPQLGDVIEAHIFQKVGDSLVMNTMTGNGGKPVSFKIQEVPVKGDLMEGIRNMKVGDSTVFRIPLDTIVARYSQQRPAWAAKGAYLSWGVKLVSIKPKSQVDAEEKIQQEEQTKMMAAAEANKGVQAATDDKLIQDYFTKNNIKDAKKTASGLYYVVTKQGDGANAMAGQKATVNYTGRNMQGETFDSNVDPAFNHVSPFEFGLGQHQVIQGWDEGVALMNKGMKATFYIPSGMAYGANARAEKIPANAILIFDIELVEAK